MASPMKGWEGGQVLQPRAAAQTTRREPGKHRFWAGGGPNLPLHRSNPEAGPGGGEGK